MMLKKHKSSLLIILLSLTFYIVNFPNVISKESSSLNRLNDAPFQCREALGWYDEHPGYKGEFNRVLEYCIKYSKDVSPEGFNVNPILIYVCSR